MPDWPFAQFAAGVLSSLDRNPADTLILDLRGNTGGNGALFWQLRDGLWQRVPALVANRRFRVYGLIEYSTAWVARPAWIPTGDAVYPDVRVPRRSVDYFSRHDPALAVALARAGKPPDPPTGEVIVVNAASFRPESGIAPGSLAAAHGVVSNGVTIWVE